MARLPRQALALRPNPVRSEPWPPPIPVRLRRPGGDLCRALRRDRRAPHQRHAAGAAAVDLPDAARHPFLELRAGGLHHAGLPGHGLGAAASGGALYGQAAHPLLAALRAGAHARRPHGAGLRAELCDDPHRRRADRASAPRSSIRRPRGWPGCPPAGATASRSRCSSSAAISAPPSARCSPPSWSSRMGRRACRGSPPWRSSRWPC